MPIVLQMACWTKQTLLLFYTVSFDKGTASKGQIPIKKKSDLPIHTKQGAVPIKTAERASEKTLGATAEKAFREAQKATITAAQKSSHAAATAGHKTPCID